MALKDLQLARVELWADVANAPSNAAAERAGYRRVGTELSYRDHGGPPPMMNVWHADAIGAEWSAR